MLSCSVTCVFLYLVIVLSVLSTIFHLKYYATKPNQLCDKNCSAVTECPVTLKKIYINIRINWAILMGFCNVFASVLCVGRGCSWSALACFTSSPPPPKKIIPTLVYYLYYSVAHVLYIYTTVYLECTKSKKKFKRKFVPCTFTELSTTENSIVLPAHGMEPKVLHSQGLRCFMVMGMWCGSTQINPNWMALTNPGVLKSSLSW